MLKLHDTLKNELVDFIPRTAGQVSIYACGPTVYDEPHLGHARTAITYDVIARYLESLGNKVTLVVNITDIDDKIIARANQEGVSEANIASKYLNIYLNKMEQLNIRKPDKQPKATECIPEMLGIIQKLLDNGVAYQIENLGIYFDVYAYQNSGAEYGSLVHQNIEDLSESAEARIEAEEGKRNQLDFALWKAAKPGEPSWESPWMAGRPGWHIECVAMSLNELGEGFDIHGGGSDLIFPHHENELAEAIGSKSEFAKYWVHSGMLNIDGEKMAKSKGNFITLNIGLDKDDFQAFRLAVLQSHYRSQMEISDESLEAAKQGYKRILNFTKIAASKNIEPATSWLESDIAIFQKCMNNDFSTPSALAHIFEIVQRGNIALSKNDTNTVSKCLASLKALTSILGFNIFDPSAQVKEEPQVEVQNLIEARDIAREKKDYAKADELREKLSQMGVQTIDEPDKPSTYLLGDSNS